LTSKKAVLTPISARTLARVDYVFIGDPSTLQPYDEQGFQRAKEVLVALAVWIGKTRLIDNMHIIKGH